jgi:hypothetical protein
MIRAMIIGKSRYQVESTKNGKAATISLFGKAWQIKHIGNGARKNLRSYQECIDYLTSKGW